ncbi:MAG: ABC transporter substrate-binding protein [Candidimonas sp.]|nr:MAG: ABC transporter substrate-binding protein [Candidimonas sp.]
MLDCARKWGKMRAPVGAAILALALSHVTPTHAETANVRVAYQYGFQYVPMLVMKHRNLIEKHARKLGIDKLHVTWRQLSGATTVADALLSGNLDFGGVGTAPLILMWSKTQGGANVKGVAALDSTAMVLTTINPNVKTLQDFTDKDRIAVPAVRSSMQALALEFAAANIWGQAHYNRLDKLTVAMKHPDAAAAMLAKSGQITAHFTVPPFSIMELNDPAIHKVIDSHQIFDNNYATQDVLYTTQKFHDENPKVYRAFLDALTEATNTAQNDRKLAADIYIQETKTSLDPAFVEKVLRAPDINYSTVPNATLKLAEFMAQIKVVAKPPAKWQDLFFPEIHGVSGS